MIWFTNSHPGRKFHAPEHGGDTTKGGTENRSKGIDPEEAIVDATGGVYTAHGRTPGTNDPGPGGSRTNIHQDEPLTSEEAHLHGGSHLPTPGGERYRKKIEEPEA